ncbi:MAG TPA: serine/threonine-protein kinase [Nannocystaceae bacterium]|nr:serine/threonine-protein kinase [Nannocystaceae bacterium]
MDEQLTETDETEPSQQGDELQIGARVGRYRITGRLGAGGMGDVYAAHDPELDRPLAVKVLARRGDEAMARMIREARAVARLSHDNVIAVFDVGTHHGRVFLAMELVDGETLRAWMQREHDLAERLAVLVAAGRGLQAAHDAGIVHGDFKPDNVLVTPAGVLQETRPRVIDFGLAREATHATAISDPDTSDSDRTQPAGTLAYMPPEQHRRGALDARADQFAFCVTAWEVLFGARPFVGDGVATLTEILAGRIITPASATLVSPRIRAALRRGLAADPRDRWPTMEALLVQLRARSWPTRAVVGVVALAITGGIAALALREPPTPTNCTRADAPTHGVWSAERRNAIAHRLCKEDRTDVPAVVNRRIDAWTEEWNEAFVEVCTRLRDEGDDWARSTDGTRLCLDRRLAELDAIVAVLDEVAPNDLVRVNNVLSGLQPLASCTDPEALAALSSLGAPRHPEQLERLFRELARATALWRAGRHADGSVALDAIADRVYAADWLPLSIEFDVARSRLPPEAETVDDAIARLEAGYSRAFAAHADLPAAELAIDLAWQFGMRRGERARTDEWLARARAIRAGGLPPTMEMGAANLEAIMYAKGGDSEAASRAFAAAIGAAIAADVPDSTIAGLVANRVRAEMSIGRVDEALAQIDEARRNYDIPAGSYRDLDFGVVHATGLRLRGDLRDAMREYTALEPRVMAATLANEATRVDLLQGIAIASFEIGDVERSIAARRELVATYEREDAVVHLTVNLVGLAEAMATKAEVGPALDEAEAIATRAMVLSQDDEIQVLGAAVRARAALRRGEIVRAREQLAIAREHVDATPDGRLRRIQTDLLALEISEAAHDDDGVRTAITAAEAELPSIIDRGRRPAILLQLARARWQIDFDRARARVLADEADAFLREHPGSEPLHASIREWLATHR